jgi:DNA repair protein RadC
MKLESFKATKRSVKEWSPDEQPREKLMHHGAEVLSNAELLAILLRTGTRDQNVVEVARNLLTEFDGSLCGFE